MSEHKQELEKKLWAIANELRGSMGADEFKNYILGLIFFKFISEKIKATATKKLGSFIEAKYLFHNLATRARQEEFIIEDLDKGLKFVEKDYIGLFVDIDLNSPRLGKNPEEKNKLISKVIEHLDEINFIYEDTELDILGDAYEYLIGEFASDAGKKAGEFYTPQQVSKILAKLVTINKTKLKNVYDPTCGSGSLLLRVSKETKVDNFYGQEKNNTTYNLARMNMILHNVNLSKFNLKQGDTLEEPGHLEKRFEAIVANPPFSAIWSANETFLSDERFSHYGRLAPKIKADFAFVQHMIYQLDNNGIMAVVLPPGVLFRGAAERVIRKYLINDKNYLDAVIGLPTNIFYGTSIPTCILVFKKKRTNPNDIFFIDASKLFEKQKSKNILKDEHVNKIIETYKNREDIDKFSGKIQIKEIIENDYNLNIIRYIDTFQEEKPVDLAAIVNKILKIDEDMKEIDKNIKKYCDELNLKAPLV